jgi:hypothetical protein
MNRGLSSNVRDVNAAQRLDVGAVLLEPEEPVVVGVVVPPVELDPVVDDRVVVLTPTRARAPPSWLITRRRLTPSSATMPPERRRSIMVLCDGALA